MESYTLFNLPNYCSALPSTHIVADFGCGEAVLSASVPNTVHSFDLKAANERVTVCDIAHTPLSDNSVDIGVFCLALMGTNWIDFIKVCVKGVAL